MADQNSRTREDTYGIRPDLFDALQNTKAAQAQSLFEALSGKSADAAKVTADLERLNAQLQAHGEAAPGGLIPAYIEANTRRWELQEAVDKAQDDAAKAIAAQVETVELLTRTIPKIIHSVRAAGAPWSPAGSSLSNAAAYGTVTYGGAVHGEMVSFNASGTWTGGAVMLAFTSSGNADSVAGSITATNRSFFTLTGGAFETYKSATVIILPDP